MAAKPLCCAFTGHSNFHPLTLLKIGIVGPAWHAVGSLEVASEETVGRLLALWLEGTKAGTSLGESWQILNCIDPFPQLGSAWLADISGPHGERLALKTSQCRFPHFGKEGRNLNLEEFLNPAEDDMKFESSLSRGYVSA